MRVYRIRRDPRYQGFVPVPSAAATHLVFDGTAREDEIWTPPAVTVDDPALRAGDFWHLHPGALVSTPDAYESIAEFFEMAGERLPLPYRGHDYVLLNVTECINCLDQKATEWASERSHGAQVSITHYAFHRNRFSQSSLFKIPETAESEILTLERYQDPEDEFKSAVEEAGLTGLLFEEIWSDGEEPMNQ